MKLDEIKAAARKLNRSDLLALRQDIDAFLKETEREALAKAKADAMEALRAAGFDNVEIKVFGDDTKPMSASNKVTEPQFRHPETGETWVGRGKQPGWIKAHIENGGDKEDFRIRA